MNGNVRENQVNTGHYRRDAEEEREREKHEPKVICKNMGDAQRKICDACRDKIMEWAHSKKINNNEHPHPSLSDSDSEEIPRSV